MLDRRQRRGELGRRALPEVRLHRRITCSALEVVLPDGEMVHIGSPMVDTPGPDLIGLFVGSEGTLGDRRRRSSCGSCAGRRACRRCWPRSTASTPAGGAVSAIIGAGIIPAAIEMMDALAIQAAEAAVHAGFPTADTILIVELDGPAAEVRALFERRRGRSAAGAARPRSRSRRTTQQRARIWRGRKAAFAAMGRVAPNYYVQDGVVPRTKLPEVLGRIRELESAIGSAHRQRVPCRRRQPASADLLRRARARRGAIAPPTWRARSSSYCVEAGGSITGEHGVGADKRDSMPKMFTDDDLDVMQRVRGAFDPRHLCNPGKVFPTPRLCGEVPGPYRQHPAEAGRRSRSASDVIVTRVTRDQTRDRARFDSATSRLGVEAWSTSRGQALTADAIDGVAPALRRRARDGRKQLAAAAGLGLARSDGSRRASRRWHATATGAGAPAAASSLVRQHARGSIASRA